jgi:DUF4097 and DUF4098 domain-containing protein YvlB
MTHRPLRISALAVALAAVAFVTSSACTMGLAAEAHDEWKRSYPLSQGGSVEIRNTNGQIRVDPVDGNTVEVVATRSARAGSDQDAQAELKHIEIAESVASNRIELDSSHGGIGFEFNVSRKVDYVVRVPRWANVTLRTTNGEILAAGVAGTFQAESTNGAMKATEMNGEVRMETTNGSITLELDKVTDAGVTCTTTNGRIDVTMPSSAQASLDVETNNGGIDPTGLDLKVSEQSRRRLRATAGGGGPTVRLETTNGGIRIRGR